MSDVFSEALVEALGDLAPLIVDDIVTGWNFKLAHLKAMQRNVAVASAAMELGSIEGLGQLEMKLTPDVFHYWGSRYGYDIWQDKGWVRRFKQDNPEVTVRNQAKKATILTS
jgi:hypothetical protein